LTANYNLGLIFLQTGAPLKAVTHLEKAHSISPHDPPVLFILVRSYFAVGRKEDGLKTALEAENNAGQDAGAFFMFGTLLLANQEFEQAAESLSQANKLAPHTPEILLSLAQADFHRGNSAQALETMEGFLGILNAASEEGSGVAAYLRTAQEILGSLKKQTPDSIQTRSLLAEVLFLEKDYEGAVQLLKDMGQEGESKPEYWNLLGMSYAGLNQFPEAFQAVIKAVDLAPQRIDLYFNLASIYQKAGDSKSAIKVLDRVIAEKETSPEVFFSLGLSYFNLGNYSTAQASFEKAVEARPDFAEAEYFIGRCNAKLQKPLQATQAYKKAMELKPGFYLAPFQLALLDLKTDHPQEAVPLLRQVVRINPGFPDAHFELGKVYSKQGNLSEAITELERAITLNSDYDPAYYQLGRLYEKVGNTEKAKAMFQIVNANKERRSRIYQEKVSGPT
jgi:tetratricopeptide (TPR) repeat protein